MSDVSPVTSVRGMAPSSFPDDESVNDVVSDTHMMP